MTDNPFAGMNIIEVPDLMMRVRRSWRERLFSRPWRPWRWWKQEVDPEQMCYRLGTGELLIPRSLLPTIREHLERQA